MRDFRTIPQIDGIQRLPRLGKIALGMRDKTKGGKEFPREVEHFVLADDSEISAALREKFVKVYGEKPLALDVVFPSEDVGDFFPCAYKLYGAGAGLKCIGDGEAGRRIGALLDKPGAEAGEFFDIDCPGEDCELLGAGQCKRVASLTFMLPRVSVAGYWQIDTSSWHSRVGVMNDLAMARRVFGRIGGLVSTRSPYPTALLLVREPKQIQHEGKLRTHWTLRVHIREAEQLDMETLQKLRLAAAGAGLMIEQHDDPPLDLLPASTHTPGEGAGAVPAPGPPVGQEPGGQGTSSPGAPPAAPHPSDLSDPSGQSGPPASRHGCRECACVLVSEADGLHCPGCQLIHDDEGNVKPAAAQVPAVRKRMESKTT